MRPNNSKSIPGFRRSRRCCSHRPTSGARTFDPSDPVVYAERKAEEAAEAETAADETQEKRRCTSQKCEDEVLAMVYRLRTPDTANLAVVALLMGLLIKLSCFNAGDPIEN